MRMNPKSGMTAADVVNLMSEEEIGRILRDYGEEKRWHAAARTIVLARSKQPILTTQDLVSVLRPIFPWQKKGINSSHVDISGLAHLCEQRVRGFRSGLAASNFIVSASRQIGSHQFP